MGIEARVIGVGNRGFHNRIQITKVGGEGAGTEDERPTAGDSRETRSG